MGLHAEDLFLEAFEKLGFKIHGRDVSTFGGRSVKRIVGKEAPDLDFIIEKDRVIYGVDVKNWLKYEFETIQKVKQKVSLALQLGVVPFVVARYVDRDTNYTEIILKGGMVYSYRDLLVSTPLGSLAEEAKNILGYPMLAVDSLPQYKVKWVEKLHEDFRRRGM